MAPKRTRSSTSLDLSAASPVLESSVTLGNDSGSTTKGVGTGSLKGKKQPLVRSGSGSGSGQGILPFSSKKNTPVTPVKSKGGKRTVAEVDDVEERAVHPMFAAAKKGDEAKHAETLVEAVDVDDAQTPSINGVSGVPLDDKWDPLLLHSAGAAPTKEMQRNLNIHTIPHATLDSSPDEQTEDQDSMTTGRRTIRGLAVRKAMLRADQKIKTLRDAKESGTKKTAGGKVKGGLNPNDKRWEKVYKAAWQAMGGDDITPIHTTSKTHTKIHHILRVFDLSPQYGPCVGISRLARWERAKAWGLEPPEEIREILETAEGAEDVTYRETVFEGTGIYCPTA